MIVAWPYLTREWHVDLLRIRGQEVPLSADSPATQGTWRYGHLPPFCWPQPSYLYTNAKSKEFSGRTIIWWFHSYLTLAYPSCKMIVTVQGKGNGLKYCILKFKLSYFLGRRPKEKVQLKFFTAGPKKKYSMQRFLYRNFLPKSENFKI